MDNRWIVWASTAGNGPTDKLLTALINRDLLRAGRSRAELPEEQRVPFRGYLDELTTLAGTGGDSIASMFEDFRKYKIQLHALTQLLSRLLVAVRQSLIQNASALSATRGSRTAVSPITEERGERPGAAQVAGLDQYDHYAFFTVNGRPVGPVLIHGPHLGEVFAEQHRPGRSHITALERAADHNARALPLDHLTTTAAGQLHRVTDFLREHAPAHRRRKPGQTTRLRMTCRPPQHPWGFSGGDRPACRAAQILPTGVGGVPDAANDACLGRPLSALGYRGEF
ncbi:hypothetical protein [Streptomyces sp. NPDC046925]|uniref:hypothetical protein n=1 Tax=Streptomyces sp. NPDC046925 TaxID=3155375 RepID=UPI0033D96D8D